MGARENTTHPKLTGFLIVLAAALASFGSLFGKSLSDPDRVGLLLATICITSLTYYFGSYVPLRRTLGASRQTSFSLAVQKIIEDYRTKSGTNATIRANVMRAGRRIAPPPRRGHWPPFQKRLEFICHYGDYRPSELEQEFPVNVGCCGTAFHDNSQTSFDSVRGGEVLKGMDSVQRDVTSHVRSILSTPIYPVGDKTFERPIGIFNLDSVDGSIQETKFDDKDMMQFVASMAGAISAIVS